MNNWYLYVSIDAQKSVDDLFLEGEYRVIGARKWIHIPNMAKTDCNEAVEIFVNNGYDCRYGNPEMDQDIYTQGK